MMASGKCALTLKEGSFVESHIIPRALTQTTNEGTGFVQVGGDAKGKKRWSSWYDNKLCTAEGEKILSDLDDWAIKFLRSNRMVWSGWGPVQQLDDHIITGPYGVRSVEVAEPDRLRLFMISLLWRAAATRLQEFKDINVLDKDLETMRVALVNNTLPPIDFYPASLSQLRTIGIKHNQSPTSGTKTVPDLGKEEPKDVPIFRFYFDGLIIHFHRTPSDPDAQALGPLIVGNEKSLTISTVDYEASLQRENLFNFIASTGI
ncbi:hypothetical protein [Agrobacterium tumefaciens]|jgi:hypothetical protein|uniref:hypothetical protein n=1 Tax=Agrobacterium tumefaciens TaxID=358 RepID=UPI002FD88656